MVRSVGDGQLQARWRWRHLLATVNSYFTLALWLLALLHFLLMLASCEAIESRFLLEC